MKRLAFVLLCACGDPSDYPIEPGAGTTSIGGQLPDDDDVARDAGVPETPNDGGVVGGSGDGGFLDAGTVPLDAGTMLPDAGTPLTDSGVF